MQQMSRHNIFIPKLPEDTRSELPWKNQYGTVQQRSSDAAKNASSSCLDRLKINTISPTLD
jgi:hypothetical protein